MPWWRNLFPGVNRPKEPESEIRLERDGFSVVSCETGDKTASVRWGHVSRIVTYKIDLFAVDCICLLFETEGNNAPVEISEDWQGFTSLFEPITNEFPTVPEDWYTTVMLPAFAPNRAILFERNIEH